MEAPSRKREGALVPFYGLFFMPSNNNCLLFGSALKNAQLESELLKLNLFL